MKTPTSRRLCFATRCPYAAGREKMLLQHHNWFKDGQGRWPGGGRSGSSACDRVHGGNECKQIPTGILGSRVVQQHFASDALRQMDRSVEKGLTQNSPPLFRSRLRFFEFGLFFPRHDSDGQDERIVGHLPVTTPFPQSNAKTDAPASLDPKSTKERKFCETYQI